MKIVLLFQTYYVPQELQILAQENDIIGIFHHNDSSSPSLSMERYSENKASVSRICYGPVFFNIVDISDVVQLPVKNYPTMFRSAALEPYVESKSKKGIFRFYCF